MREMGQRIYSRLTFHASRLRLSIGTFPPSGEHSAVRFLAVIFSLLLCSAAPLWARLGVVRTVGGDVVRGHVRIMPDRIMVVNAELSSIHAIDASNVARLSFPNNAVAPLPAVVDEALPAGWRETGLGRGRLTGTTRHERGTFTVRGAGSNIDGEADSFHYVYKAVRGDSEIVAEVTSIQYTHPNAKAGLMMRENLGDYSRNVMIALTAMSGGAVQFRAHERFGTEGAGLGAVFAPHWLKLKRRGNEFSAFVSANGRAWSLVARISLEMNESFYVGLAVASAQEGVLNWTTFTRVREAPKLVNEDFTPQVDLVSGSTVIGRPERADENEISFQGAPKLVRVPTGRVARIAFQPLSSDLAWKTRVSRPGVWVSNGDFFDGEFRGIARRELTISSVLYGLRTFDIDDEVVAVVLQPRKGPRLEYEIEMIDGSVLRAPAIALGDGEIKLRESALGEVRVPAFEIVEFRRW